MSRLFFVDVDTQNDFMLQSGALYVPGAERLKPKLRRLFDFAVKNDIKILSTVDAHTADDPEFRQFPPHCIKGTKGQKKLAETQLPRPLVLENRKYDRNLSQDIRNHSQIIVEKQSIDVFTNPVLEKLVRILPPRAIVFGVTTEYCVRSACLGLRLNNVQTVLITDVVAALSTRSEIEALNKMKKAGVEFITLDALFDLGSR